MKIFALGVCAILHFYAPRGFSIIAIESPVGAAGSVVCGDVFSPTKFITVFGHPETRHSWILSFVENNQGADYPERDRDQVIDLIDETLIKLAKDTAYSDKIITVAIAVLRMSLPVRPMTPLMATPAVVRFGQPNPDKVFETPGRVAIALLESVRPELPTDPAAYIQALKDRNQALADPERVQAQMEAALSEIAAKFGNDIDRYLDERYSEGGRIPILTGRFEDHSVIETFLRHRAAFTSRK